MKGFLALLFYGLCGSAALVSLLIMASPALSFRDVGTLFAGAFFVEGATPEELQQSYRDALKGKDKIRVLIVPGHDSIISGAEFRGVREADMTVAVGEELTKMLSADPIFEPLLVRSRAGYAPGFEDYFAREREQTRTFIAEKKQTMRELVRAGSVHLEDGVIHNTASTEVAIRLYTFNTWANKHGVDMVLHLHFNDYPGRPHTRPARYDGFSIYVPDSQFSNARVSRALASALLEQFSKLYVKSNLPIEEEGVVEDQDLIAVGAYNTLDPAGLLIEYGYMYEPKFLDAKIRERMMKELAFQTYQGINRFFGKYGELFQKYPTTLLPHTWREPLASGVTNHGSVLALQTALLLEGLYPPSGYTKRDCPITGSFGPCTAASVKLFQEKYKLPVSGVVDTLTLQILNEMYSR